MSRRYDFAAWCPHCNAYVEYERFGEPFRCWHCGRSVEIVHECDESDCADYLMPEREDR